MFKLCIKTETTKHMGNKDNKAFPQIQTASLQCPTGHIMNPPCSPPPQAPRCPPSSCQFPSQLRGFAHALLLAGKALPYRFVYPSKESSKAALPGRSWPGQGWCRMDCLSPSLHYCVWPPCPPEATDSARPCGTLEEE